MRLKFGHLCDFATADSQGKPIIVGAFDVFTAQTFDTFGPVQTPPFSMMLALACPSMEGTRHDIAIRLLDADGREIGATHFPDLVFGTRIVGSELTAYLIHRFSGIAIGIGDYSFEVAIVRHHLPRPGADGWEDASEFERIGELPFHVARLTASVSV